VVEVSEQDIMDWEILANRNGHIACTHGGESLAGLVAALNRKLVGKDEVAVLDSTAHVLKFAGFQDMYFNRSFPEGYNITPKAEMINAPVYVHPADLDQVPAAGKPLKGPELERFVRRVTAEIAHALGLQASTPKRGIKR
jgi:threonine synthase